MASLDRETKSQLVASGFHEHNMLVYPDLDTFREMYCMYAKMHLQPKYNEIMLIASHYEPVGKVRDNLSDYGVDVDKHEKDGSLVTLMLRRGTSLMQIIQEFSTSASRSLHGRRRTAKLASAPLATLVRSLCATG